MTMGQKSADLTIRDLTVDDLDEAFDVRSRSFGRLSAEMRGWWNDVQQESINGHRAIGVFDGSRLVAHARVRSYQQFWGGRPMAMGGVAGVVVAPDARGRGVGTRLMTALAHRSLELGDLVSALYPATIPIYRGLGWEVAGAQYRISIPAEALRTLGGRDVPLRKATTSDVGPFLASLHDRYAAQRANGPKLPTEDEAREQLTDDGMMSYFAEGGHVVYEWAGEDLVVSYLSADTSEVARALWSVVGSGSSTVRKVGAYVAPQDAIHYLLSEEVAHETYLKRWMLRVLDAPKAIAARGFSPAVSGSVAIALQDPLLPVNSGSWQMQMSGGRAELIPIAATDVLAPSLRLGPNGFAAMFAGAPVRLLRAAGLASGGDQDGDELLDAAFAGSPAYLLEYF
jgi:predicted acetyltransferase